DLECLFTPPLDPPPQLPPARQALVGRIETTVIRTAMPLQPWLASPEGPARDVGCLSHFGDPLEVGGATPPIAPYRPWLDTDIADPWNHADDVTSGYREMHRVLLANRDKLLCDDGPLHGFAGIRTRYIWRGTSDCRSIVRASVSPTALV